MILVGVLILVQLLLAASFIAGLLTDKANNLFLGTILGVEFLVLGLALVAYIRTAVPPVEIAEDRREGLLW